MKSLKFAAALAACASILLSACSTIPDQAQTSQRQIYDESAARIEQMYRSGKITHLQSVQQMQFLAKQQFPNDYLLNASWARVVQLSEDLAEGKLTKDQFNAMLDEVWSSFESANKARHEQAQQESQRQRNSAATATLLQGIGNAFRRTYPGGTTCNTWGNNTTCTNY